MATKSTKKLIDEERKPLVVGKSPEIKPGSSGSGPGSPGSPGAPTKESKKSYQTMPSSEPSKTTSGPSASSAESAGGYQSSPGPSTSDPSTPVASRSSLARQIFLGTVIALPSVPCGMSLAFSAVTFDSLNLSVEAASWYASVTIMSFPFGGLLVGQLMDQYGRKPALLSITVVSLIGWLMLSVPSSDVSLAKLIIGRILTGVAGGLASVPAAVYAAECLCPNNVKMRSSLVTWSTVALSIGIFLVYICGAFLVYYNVASIATLISLLALVLVAIFIPESPVWLASKGRHGDAEWSEREIAIAPPPVLMEEPSASEWEDSPKPQPPPPPPETSTFSELKKPEVYKPLLIMVGFLFFQQFSGVYVVIAYMVDIIRAAGVVTVNAYWLSIVGGAVIVCVAILASFIYPKTGVRAIAALSSFGTAITMFWIGIFLSTRHLWVGNSKLYFLNWIPVILIISNIALSTSGFLILPWSMLGEVFPLNIKGVAAGIATCLGFTFSFIVLKVYPYIQLGFGVSEVFYFFGLMALLGSMFVVAFLPETHGKTLQEIIDEFTKKKSKPGKTTENTSSIAEKQPEPPKKAEKKTEKKSEKKPSTAEKDFKKAEIQV